MDLLLDALVMLSYSPLPPPPPTIPVELHSMDHPFRFFKHLQQSMVTFD